jgi:hypothetical protein
MTLEQEARSSREWPLWIGDKDRLLRLVRLMNEITEDDRTAELARKQDELDWIFDSNKDAQADHKVFRKALEAQYEATRLKLSASMEVVEREISLTRRGEAAEVVEGIDPPAVIQLELAAPREVLAPNRVVLRMSKKGSCTLEVKGSDPTWLYSAREALSSEIQRGVPWWAFLRKFSASLASAAVLYVALVLALWDHVIPTTEAGAAISFQGKLLIWTLVGIVGVLVIALMLDSLLRRVIPGLEIISPGETPKSGKALAFMGSMMASFVLGIVVNLITS